MTRVKLAELTGVVFSPFMGELEGVRPLSSFTLQIYDFFSNFPNVCQTFFTQNASFFGIGASAALLHIDKL
jgi:hypothetical protein